MDSEIILIHSQTFIFSTVLKNPDHYFQGYCFHAANYIYGDIGAAEYREETGRIIGQGEDGCYVSIHKEGKRFIVSNDFSGFKKVFYFWRPGFWVVSNSISLLVKHLNDFGVSVSPNFSQLAAMAIGKNSSFLNQLTSYTTIANGVYLVPLGHTLSIGNDGVSLINSQIIDRKETYKDALHHFLNLWVSRFETLLSKNILIKSDLTGGLDSRAVFSILQKARQRLGVSKATIGINCGASRTSTADREVAAAICKSQSMVLNERLPPSPGKFNGYQSYQSWRQLCLGVYYPIYFPMSHPVSDRISFSGGGGENHRPFYKWKDVQEFIKNCGNKIEPSWLRTQFKAELREIFRELGEVAGSADRPELLHYRNFRNRLHTGRTPQSTVVFAPLASRYLEQASEVAGAEKMSVGQLNYDIIFSSCPELLDMPFDLPKKTPSSAIRQALIDVEIDSAANPGGVYGVGYSSDLSTDKGKAGRAIDFLKSEFEACLNYDFVQSFLGTKYIADAESIMTEAAKNGGFQHAIEGQPVAAVLAAGLFV